MLALFVLGVAAPAQAACPASMPDALFKNCISEEMEGIYALLVDNQITLAAHEATIVALEAENADLQTQLDAVGGGIEGLDSYLWVDEATDSVYIEGANVFIQSGSGATDDNGSLTGLGNLIVGYNEDAAEDEVRTGSHNLVVGEEHDWTSYGGLLAGFNNTVSGPYASVSGGHYNTASANSASVSGGQSNTAGAQAASITGGISGDASGAASSITGGYEGTAEGDFSTVSGGLYNTGTGEYSWAGGGYYNIAYGNKSSVYGGYSNTITADYDYGP